MRLQTCKAKSQLGTHSYLLHRLFLYVFCLYVFYQCKVNEHDVYMRFFLHPKNLDPSARDWLKSLLSIFHNTEIISVKLKESKIITIPYNLTSNKQHREFWCHLSPVHNYLFEQLLLARLTPLVERFTTGRTTLRRLQLRSTFVLTTFLEAEYQRLIKTYTAPFDLSSDDETADIACY